MKKSYIINRDRLNEITEKAFEAAEAEMNLRVLNGYSDVERNALEVALSTASEVPGNERKVWELMISSIAETNEGLKREGHLVLYGVSYDVFTALLAERVGRDPVH